MKRWMIAALALVSLAASPHESTSVAMRAELQRAQKQLSLPGKSSPYFTSYWVVDAERRDVVATLGALLSDETTQGRVAQAEVRVGSSELDNSGFLGDGYLGQGGPGVPESVPMADPAALRHSLWLLTDSAYKNAVETLEKKRAQAEGEIRDEDEPASFSKHGATQLAVEPEPDAASFDPVAYAKRVSAVFREFPEIQTSLVQIVLSRELRHFVSSEGSDVRVPTLYRGVAVQCATQADDGMPLSRTASFEVVSGALPSVEAVVERARTIARELVELRHAPVIDDYSGPVLFEDVAAPQLMLELLADALGGTPAPKGAETLESPLTRKLGKRVLPTSFDVVDDPTLKQLGGQPLLGFYRVDDEGVPAERVSLVEKGRLRSFLMSRAPHRKVEQSNGHGRSGLSGWARGTVGNLMVSARGGLGNAALERRLLSAVREEGGEHGLVIRALEPRTNGTGGQAAPPPVLVYEIGLDGKRKLVRGATFSPLSVRDLKDILAAGRKPVVYSYSAATPGGFDIPASVAAPALLFEDIELRSPSTPFKRPPAVSRPALGEGGGG